VHSDDKTVVPVDEGIATGSTVLVGLRALAQRGVAPKIVASPVAAPETADRLLEEGARGSKVSTIYAVPREASLNAA
jgi:predicted phosphoribosyltransferase